MNVSRRIEWAKFYSEETGEAFYIGLSVSVKELLRFDEARHKAEAKAWARKVDSEAIFEGWETPPTDAVTYYAQDFEDLKD